jgi:hypothetical protein
LPIIYADFRLDYKLATLPAQEPHAHLRLNAAGVEKMSEVLLGFAEPILDRLAPLDEKKAMLSSPSLS